MDPLEAGKLLILLGGLAGIYLKMGQAMRTMAGKGEAREITNDPLNVREVPEYMSRREGGILLHALEMRLTHLEARFDKHIGEVQKTTDALRHDIESLRDRLDDKLSTMSEDIREISRAIGRLEGS